MFESSRQVACALLLIMFPLVSGAQSRPFADPLRPPAMLAGDGSLAVDLGLPNVTMIVTRGQNAYAVIDGSVRRAGERFGPFRVTRIDLTEVVLVRDDATTLALPLLPAVRAKQPLDQKP